jgi:hypothetical protein
MTVKLVVDLESCALIQVTLQNYATLGKALRSSRVCGVGPHMVLRKYAMILNFKTWRPFFESGG